MKLLLKFLSFLLAIYIVTLVFDTAYFISAGAILVMGLVLLIVNLVLRPILLIISLPINLLTFGLFSFVVNAVTIMIADGLVAGVHLGGFLHCLLASLIIVVINNLLLESHKTSNHSRRA